jgi:peptide deformylase
VGEVTRHEQVTVKGLDERGRPVRYKVEGYLARAFQHELDHLDGILYTDRLTDPASFRPVQSSQEDSEELEAALAQNEGPQSADRPICEPAAPMI